MITKPFDLDNLLAASPRDPGAASWFSLLIRLCGATGYEAASSLTSRR